MTSFLHQHTPSLTVIDPRGLSVRGIAYHRREVEEVIGARVHRQVFDAQGRLIQQWDPRLLELIESEAGVQPNQSTRYSLNGQVLLTENVDAGWRASCHDAAGLLRDSWDGRDTHRRYAYDELMRPMNVFELEPPLCVERFTYAGADEEDVRHNRCAKLIRHDDQAGSLWHETFTLTGQPQTEIRRFCRSLILAHWPESETDLEDAPYTTHWRHDALGAVIEQVDALEHVQRFEFDVAGQSFASWLDDVALLKSTTYNAFGHVEIELAGNDVTSTAYYSARDGRLSNLKAKRSDGKTLQDLHYQYDPVGNITRIEDLAQPVQWFAGQRIQAVSTYTYDTLYQLISATGRESASQSIGPDLPGLEIFGPIDDSRWRTYSQIYTYDSGGNLTHLHHDAGAGNAYTREMVVDTRSNRSLSKGGTPIDFAKGFDANGNQQALAPGQRMQWDTRNQLQQVTQVQRDGPDSQDDDTETYVYDGSGQRVRKVRRAKTRGGEHISEVRYLPGLEIRSRTVGQQLHVVIAQAGRNSVRLLNWDDGRDQHRYSLSDHLGSSTLELNERGEVLSQESYYPYGGTAWWAAKSALEARDKVIRYSGKERDATGLYYYGFRYYAPWLQRWINPDPAGDVDGLNLFCMVRSNPASLKDSDGRESNFHNLFKPEKGDLIFGLAKVLDKGYLSWWAALTGRGDYLAKYLNGDTIAALEKELDIKRDSYNSLRDSTWFMPKDTANLGFWEGQYKSIAELVFLAEKKYYTDIKIRYEGLRSTAANTDFAQRYVAEMSGGNYSVRNTFEKYVDSEKFGDKLISRASKAGLATILKSERDDVIHFTLDELDMNQVVMKTRSSATSSELRYLYRHRAELVDKVLFYREGQLVDAPWRTDKASWSRYKPKKAISARASSRQ